MYSFLIVDDEPIIRRGLRRMLEESALGISQIREADDGIHALTLLQEEPSSIIITDIKMPKMGGLELCSKIYKRSPDIPIILVSGYEDFKYAQEALKYGVKDYLLKPLSQEKLVETVSRVILGLEEYTACFYVPYSCLNEVVRQIEQGLWSNESSEINQGIEDLFELLKDINIHHRIKTCCEVLSMIVHALSLKIGYSLRFQHIQFSGAENAELQHWFIKAVHFINQEINERKLNTDYNLIEMTRNYIKENYSKDISLDDIAKKIGLNASYFSQLFKQKTGKTFVHFKSEVRLQEAMRLLCQPEKNVTEVALDVGFNDITYFARAFKKYTGLSPSEFREKRGIGK